VTPRNQAARGTRARPKTVRRRLRPEDRKAELLEAAVRVLGQRGPDGCRIEDITNAAGTAKGNFYRYFPTWDDLVLAVRDHILDSYRAELRQRYGDRSSVDWWLALDDEVERFVDFQLALGGLHDVVFHGPAALARPRETYRSASFMIATFLTAGIADGAFEAVDVGVTAPLLFEVLHGAADAVASGLDRQRVLTATRQLAHRALAPSP
jgi:AcrR family transcriptional regulator